MTSNYDRHNRPRDSYRSRVYGVDAKVANPELKICTLTDDVRFACEMQVKKGRGYETAEDNVSEEQYCCAALQQLRLGSPSRNGRQGT